METDFIHLVERRAQEGENSLPIVRDAVGTGPAEVFMYQQRVEFNAAGAPNMGKPEVDSAGSPATFVIIPSGEPGSPPVRLNTEKTE